NGQVAEICLQAEGWLGAATRDLAAGGLLAIDYGHSTEALYGPERARGTLIAQQRFQLFDDVLAHPGDRDLTAHVDFGNLERLGAREGLRWGGRCSLRVFLIGMGAVASNSGSVQSRLALRHLLVSEIGDAHSVAWLHKGIAGLPFGRDRLRTPA
ncbi:MAG: SAM-dependent methyltransferase, partial [Anaerolineae bacterium]